MSKTKTKVIDGQNARQEAQPNAVAALLQGTEGVTAQVVEGFFHEGTATPPAIYVQSDTRLVVVAPDGDTARELCEKVTATLAPDYNVTTLGQYGTAETTGKVWYDIDINPKKK